MTVLKSLRSLAAFASALAVLIVFAITDEFSQLKLNLKPNPSKDDGDNFLADQFTFNYSEVGPRNVSSTTVSTSQAGQKGTTSTQISNQELFSTTPTSASTIPTTSTRSNEHSDTNIKPANSSNKSLPIVNGGYTEYKTVLLWSRDKSNKTFWPPEKWGHKIFRNCPYSACELTGDRRRLKEVSVVFFNFNESPDWPSWRSADQLYVHKLIERPCKAHEWLRGYDNRINLTLNYRQDADLSLYRPLYKPHKRPKTGPYKPRIPLKDKIHQVIWPVSNCVAASQRYEYVTELSKHIDVHIYGKCGNYSCDRTDPKFCLSMFESKYKFYISFENVICADYVTEKLRFPLEHELIPIVMGGSNYSELAPPHSYIDVRDFNSPRDLAQYLHQLSQDETQYNAYFQWKQQFSVLGPSSFLCHLCKAATVPTYRRPAHTHYFDWWFGACDNELVPRMRARGGW